MSAPQIVASWAAPVGFTLGQWQCDSGAVLYPSFFRFPLLIPIPSQLHTHLPHLTEVRDNLGQTGHYYISIIKFGASSQTRQWEAHRAGDLISAKASLTPEVHTVVICRTDCRMIHLFGTKYVKDISSGSCFTIVSNGRMITNLK